MTSPYTPLIERLRVATGPSRELDRLVARAIGWHRVEPRHTRAKAGAWIAPQDFLGVDSHGAPILDSLHGTEMHREPPAFTGSVDAAMTLVPDGHGWGLIKRSSAVASAKKWHASVDLFSMEPPASPAPMAVGGYSDSNGAIALCIAALEARAALSPNT